MHNEKKSFGTGTELSSHSLTATFSGQEEGTEPMWEVQFVDKQSASDHTPDNRKNERKSLMATDHEREGFYSTETAQSQTDASKATGAVSDNSAVPHSASSY